STSLEVDDAAQIISYEEYYPYGSTSYQAGRNAAEVSLKRYRYTARERDEETGFAYHGARYYVAWLGRWAVPDPASISFDLQLYSYSAQNPIRLIDPTGFEPVETPASKVSPQRRGPCRHSNEPRDNSFPNCTLCPRTGGDALTDFKSARPFDTGLLN